MKSKAKSMLKGGKAKTGKAKAKAKAKAKDYMPGDYYSDMGKKNPKERSK